MGRSRFTDLDDFLERELGYGNSWETQAEKLQIYEAQKRESDIQRITEYNTRYPERHRETVNNYYKRKTAEARKLGKVNCPHCGRRLTVHDLSRNNKCKKCGKPNNILRRKKNDE